MKISDNERVALYKIIFARRDVRKEFLPNSIPDEVLGRILKAAHHAPSVGFMQPWDFVIVQNHAVKTNIKAAFEKANDKAAQLFEKEKQEKYQSLKLEGIIEAPLGICVTCDHSRKGPVVLGRTSVLEMDLYSTVCAIQNIWLAARAENIGVGWVSILEKQDLRNILGIPDAITPVAYLCMGYVSQFKDKPDLEDAGWLSRENIEHLIHYDHWSSVC